MSSEFHIIKQGEVVDILGKPMTTYTVLEVVHDRTGLTTMKPRAQHIPHFDLAHKIRDAFVTISQQQELLKELMDSYGGLLLAPISNE